MADPWNIPATGEQCDGCGRALEAGGCVTTLLQLGADGPRRQDLCEACDPAVDKRGEAFFWRRSLPVEEGHRLVVDYALLKEIFPVLLARPEETYHRLSYLVALVLVRKRYLRLHRFDAREGGGEVMVVSPGADRPDLEVPAPELSSAQLKDASEQLRRLLRADVEDDDLAALLPKASDRPGQA